MLSLAFLATLSHSLPALSFSKPVLQEHSTIHERQSPGQRSLWLKRERIAQDEIIQIRIGLTQQNTYLGHNLLMEVSDPQSPKYGQHWSSDEVAKIFAPSDKTIHATVNWITSTLDIEPDQISLNPGKGWLSFYPSVAEAESLFQTEYWLYKHEIEGNIAAGVEHYSLPQGLGEHIDFIFPGVVLGEVRPGYASRMRQRASKNRRQDPANATCADLLTPACIKELYGLPTASKAHPNNSMGIYETGSWYQFEDLDLFFENYALEIPQGSRPQNLSVDQASWFYNDPNDTYTTFPDEADLDIQVAWPVIYPQNITVFQVDDAYYNLKSATLGIFNTFLDALDSAYCNYSAYGETGDDPAYDASYPDNNVVTSSDGGTYDTYTSAEMCGVYEPTNVISISYSVAETTFTESYQKRQCDEFLKLGLMGVSVVVASGDSGPMAARQCSALYLGTFSAQYPVNCPYVTSVGATQLLTNGTEIAVQSDDWASSGGFSNIYPTPSYQQNALAAYFANYNPTNLESLFNASGRGIPDVSAVGANIAVAVNGVLSTGDGTSAAAPLFAAMLNLVNEERLAVGKGTVGFVNPVLYANSSLIFRDITLGNNNMCGGLQPGFNAVPGWDPVTGLGTAQWEGLREVFISLP